MARATPSRPVKLVVHEYAGCRSEGRYEWHCWSSSGVGRGYWQLACWRIRVRAGEEFGEWHKVHGNRKRPIGGLKLVLDP